MNRRRYSGIRFVAALVFLALATAAISGADGLIRLLSFQPGPLWIRLGTGATVGGIVLTVSLLASTFLFGRYFCAFFCPLGTCQDAIEKVRPKRHAPVPNLPVTRYGIAATALVLLAGGWATLFRHLDPFSRFGAMVGAATGIAFREGGAVPGMFYGGALPLILLVALVIWKRRLYCVSLCPVGTVLGAAAKFSVWRMRIRESCLGCGRCDAACPTGCVDSAARSIDAERCVLCLQCVSACPNGSVRYEVLNRKERWNGGQAVDGSRRRFLLAGSALALGACGMGRGLSGVIQGVARATESSGELLLPPGAGDPERFVRQCTGCQVCTASCPVGIIKPSRYGFGPVRLDYSQNGCDYHCTRCNTVCPSGALAPHTLEDKQWLKIGEARIDLPNCRVVKDGVACDLCAAACPKDAILMMEGPDGIAVPEVAAFHCIGCGMCQAACPVSPKAAIVDAVGRQSPGF